ncbi:MAG TPA: SDR family NAD(P)-dependent oxidoreductase [Acidimicrobiales bacterium]|nr:SDR family NAD(P)-dependent oxidoreductase [Acidimicrobiales bacterium]
MTGRLAGKVALVTGAASGIGRASALLFVAEGATVVGCDLQDEMMRETVEMARAARGAMSATAPVDLGDPAAAKAWVDAAAAEHGGIDVVFNNAGGVRFGSVDKLPVEDWQFTVRNELDLVFYVTRAAWPHLVARGGGAIVNMASISATRGPWFMPQNAHGATKAGVLGLTYELAVEGGPFGIRVNAISPALTRTPATAPLVNDPALDAEFLRIPLGRIGEPEDVARAALFLASDDASYISGVNLPVDGGHAAVG